MIKKAAFITLGALTFGVAVWFYFVQKRNGYIDELTANMFVTINNFESIPTGMLAEWTKHLKELSLGKGVSFSSFTFNGVNYDIRTGQKI